MQKLLSRVQLLVKLACSISIALMAAVVFIQVVNRNVFDSSFKWVEELSTMCMVCITFLGAALATSLNAHTRIELFVNLLPGNLPKIIFALGDVVCAVFCISLVFYCWPLIMGNLHTMSPAMKLPLSINYIVFAVSMTLSAVYLLLRVISRFKGEEPQAFSSDKDEESVHSDVSAVEEK